jgi:hypothetical protein
MKGIESRLRLADQWRNATSFRIGPLGVQLRFAKIVPDMWLMVSSNIGFAPCVEGGRVALSYRGPNVLKSMVLWFELRQLFWVRRHWP